MRDNLHKNINQIDFLLKENFKLVKTEKINLKNDFLIKIDLTHEIVKEQTSFPVELTLFINARELSITESKFNWTYLTKSGNNDKITILSDICNIHEDIRVIFDKKRLDEEYINSCYEKHLSLIKEQSENLSFKDLSKLEKVREQVNKFTSIKKEIEQKIHNTGTVFDKWEKRIIFYINENISMPKRLKLEVILKTLDIDSVYVGEDRIILIDKF